MSKIKQKSKKVVVERGWEIGKAKQEWNRTIFNWFTTSAIIAGAFSVAYFIYKLIIN